VSISRRRLFLGSAAAAAAAQEVPRAAEGKPTPAIGRRFRGRTLQEIAFPLGGIGTGAVSLGGYGNLRDWEIFNRPAKGSHVPRCFAALRLAGGGLTAPLIRLLERQPLPPYRGAQGLPKGMTLGAPRFRAATFFGAYPFAELRFEDARLPADVTLEAFNPMIPLETDDSSLPVAILTYRVTSRAPSKMEGAIAFSMMNVIGASTDLTYYWRGAAAYGGNLNEFKKEADAGGMLVSSVRLAPESARYGSIAVATVPADLSYRMEWQGRSLRLWWDEFLEKGRFADVASQPTPDRLTEFGTVASHFVLAPGETKQVPFVLAWHFPNTVSWRANSTTRTTSSSTARTP
jgi:non-lysosomal glucosylceramidase